MELLIYFDRFRGEERTASMGRNFHLLEPNRCRVPSKMCRSAEIRVTVARIARSRQNKLQSCHFPPTSNGDAFSTKASRLVVFARRRTGSYKRR